MLFMDEFLYYESLEFSNNVKKVDATVEVIPKSYSHFL